MDSKLEKIEQEIKLLNTRVSTIEAALSSSFSQRPAPQTSIPETATPVAHPYPGNSPTNTRRVESNKPISSSQLLAITSVICFVLASSFTINLALESGWLTPIRQLGLSLALGIVLCLAGRYWNYFTAQYRSYLSGAGSIVLFLSSYGSSLLFNAISPFSSIILTLISAGVTLVLYDYHKNDLFAFIATIGTFICPLVFKQNLGDLYLMSFYFISWSGVFSYMSIKLRSRTLSIIACYLSLGIFAASNQSTYSQDLVELLSILATLFVIFMMFAGGVFKYSIKNDDPLAKRESWLFFPVLCFFYGITFYYVGRIGNLLEPTLGSFVSSKLDSLYGLSIGGIVFYFYTQAKARFSEIHALNSKEMIEAFLCLALFHSGYLTLVPAGFKTWLLPISVLGILLSNDSSSKIGFIFRFLIGAIGFIEWLSLLENLLLSDAYNWNKILSGVSVLVLGSLYYFRSGRDILGKNNLFLWSFHLLAVSIAFRLASDFGSLAVTGAWATYAVAVLVLGYSKREQILAKSSLLILLFVAGKALIYDAAHAPSGIRIACLLLTGAVLYGAGHLFKKMSEWTA